MIDNWPGRLAGIGIVAVAWVLLPALYRQHLVERANKELHELIRTQQPLPRQLAKIERLLELNASDIKGVPLRALRNQIQDQNRQCVSRLRGVDDAIAKAQTSEDENRLRFQKGLDLFLLDRLDESALVLTQLAPTHPRASLLLAVVLQDRGQWPQSDRWYAHTLKLTALASDRKMAELARRQSVDGLAFNARHERRYGDAEAAYLRALVEYPESRAYFHLQLGRHYQQGGRPAAALEQFESAIRLAPRSDGDMSRVLTDKLRTQTPGCLIGMTK